MTEPAPDDEEPGARRCYGCREPLEIEEDVDGAGRCKKCGVHYVEDCGPIDPEDC